MWAMYRGRFPFGSFDEVRALAAVVSGITLLLSLVIIPLGPLLKVPRGGTVLLSAPIA